MSTNPPPPPPTPNPAPKPPGPKPPGKPKPKPKNKDTGPKKDTPYYGYSGINDASANLIKPYQYTINLEITSRIFGFLVQTIYGQVTTITRNPPECTLYALYRVTLLQATYKYQIALAHRRSGASSIDPRQRSVRLDYDYAQAALSCRQNFKPLAMIIEAFGNFEYLSTSYNVFISNDELSPFNVMFDNLRNTVRALSNVATPVESRRAFFDRNSLPGAQWNEIRGRARDADGEQIEGNGPILANPEDFWPEGYDRDALDNDINAVMGLITYAIRKNYRHIAPDISIDYDKPGSRSQLVTADMREDNLRLPEVRHRQPPPVQVNPHYPYPTGISGPFYLMETLESPLTFLGALSLMGESNEGARTLARMKYGAAAEWRTITMNILSN